MVTRSHGQTLGNYILTFWMLLLLLVGSPNISRLDRAAYQWRKNAKRRIVLVFVQFASLFYELLKQENVPPKNRVCTWSKF